MSATGARPYSAAQSHPGTPHAPGGGRLYRSCSTGLRLVAHDANLPFLASLIAVALEEAKSTKSAGKSQG